MISPVGNVCSLPNCTRLFLCFMWWLDSVVSSYLFIDLVEIVGVIVEFVGVEEVFVGVEVVLVGVEVVIVGVESMDCGVVIVAEVVRHEVSVR